MALRTSIIVGLLGATSVSAAVHPASAQAASQRHSMSFDIPAGELAPALQRFARQSRIQVLYSAADLQGRHTTGVQGQMAPVEALDRLVQGSGAEVVRDSSGAFLVKPQRPLASVKRSVLAQNNVQGPAPMPADAAPAPADTSAGELDDIIVTAQKRQESLQDVPISVAVVRGEALQQMGFTSLQRVADMVPGFRITSASGANLISLRGVGSGNNAGFEQAVGTFVDGVYRPRSRTITLGLFDLERIEVLRGPQTTFFGANTIAGALNIVTKRPTNSTDAYVSARYVFDIDEYNVEGAANVPIVDDVLLMRVALRATGMDGYVRNERLKNTGPRLRDRQGRVSVLFTPSDRVSIDARVDYIRQRGNGTVNNEIVGCPPPVGAPTGQCLRVLGLVGPFDDKLNYHTWLGDTFSDQDYVEAPITTRIEIGDHTLTSVTAYAHQKYDTFVDIMPLPGLSPVGTQNYLVVRQPERYNQFSQELRLESDPSKRLGYLVGAYFEYGKLKLDAVNGYFFAPIGAQIGLGATTPIGADVDFRQKQKTYSVFGAVHFQVTDQLRLAAGLRYLDIRKTGHHAAVMGVTNNELTTFSPLTPAQAVIAARAAGVALTDFAQTSRNVDKFLPSIDIQYELTPDVMAYGKYSTGVKAGGFDGTANNSSYDAETVRGFEIGLKSTLFDRRATINIAAFRSNFKNLQESAIINNVARVSNAGRARSQGIEFESRFRAAEWMTLGASGTYLDSQFVSFPNAACTTLQSFLTPAGTVCQQDLSGRPRPFAPKFSSTLSLDLEVPILDELDLKFHTDLYYSTRYFMQGNLDPLVIQPAYERLNMRLSLTPPNERWEVSLIANNVTNTLVRVNNIVLPSTQATTAAVADLPRTFAVQTTFKW